MDLSLFELIQSVSWYHSVGLLVVLWYSSVWLLWSKDPKRPKKILAVLGSGGHTSEILQVLKDWKGEICAVCASGDLLSKSQFADRFNGEIWEVYRSRRVGQGYFSSVFTTLYSFLPALWVFAKARPDLIVSNGPGTALPLCYIAWIWRFVCLERIVIVYVESVCRVKSLSLAGKLIYPISDEFYVQWENLHEVYPKTKYIGMLSV